LQNDADAHETDPKKPAGSMLAGALHEVPLNVTA
jgi:hypothetical protein